MKILLSNDDGYRAEGLAALGLASAAPSTPGYVGIYQFVAVSVLAPFGFVREQALVFVEADRARRDLELARQLADRILVAVGGALRFHDSFEDSS